MRIMIFKVRKLVILIIALLPFLSSCDPRYGFVENELELAPESRLPIWFKMPAKYSRSDITVTITTYSSPLGFKTRIVIHGPAPDFKVLMDKVGTKRMHPYTEQRGYFQYPLYAIISIAGTEEVYEQRRPEPIFYISDDPSLQHALKNQSKP